MSHTGSIRSARVLQQQELSDNVPHCECNAPCKGPTQVKKQNHNHGRWFYSCQSGACNFFKWAPDQPNTSSHAAGGSSSSPSGRVGGHGNFPASGGRVLGGAGGSGGAVQGGGASWVGGSPSSLIGSPLRSQQQQYQPQHVPGSPNAFGQQQQLMGSPVSIAQRLRQAFISQGHSPSKSADGGSGQMVVHLELMEGVPDRFVSRQRYSRDFIDAVKSTGRRNTEYAWNAEERVWTFALTHGSFSVLSETLEREGFRVMPAPDLLERLGIPTQEASAGIKRPGPSLPPGQASPAAMAADSPSSHRSKLRRVNLFGDEANPPFPSMEFDLTCFSQSTQATGGAHASGSGLGRGGQGEGGAVPSRRASEVGLPRAVGSLEEVMVVGETRGASQQGPQGRRRSRQAGRGTGADGNSAEGAAQQHGSGPRPGAGAGGMGRVSAVIDLTLSDEEGEEQRGEAVRRRRRGGGMGQPACAAIARADAASLQTQNAGGGGAAGASSAAGVAGQGEIPAAAAADDDDGADGGSGAGLECVICLSAPREVGLLHGGTMHLCVCKDCAKVIRTRQPCPICRAPISKIISVYT